jgi:phosphoglycolate phosphatase-like HAD superfamily hydrolase
VSPSIRGGVFDVGYTLLDETRRWREWAARTKAGWPDDEFLPADLCPDVAPCLQRLKAAGLPFDIIGSSQRWGVDKPDPMFFARVIEAMGLQAEQLAYAGDRLDSDAGPSAAAGMCAVYLQRGLWAEVQSDRSQAASAHAVIDPLDELPAALPTFGRESGSPKEK